MVFYEEQRTNVQGYWGCLFFTLRYHLPKPHLPSGIAFSWIGDGLSKPAFLSPFNTELDKSKPSKLIFSLITTSPVLAFSAYLWATFDISTTVKALFYLMLKWHNMTLISEAV